MSAGVIVAARIQVANEKRVQQKFLRLSKSDAFSLKLQLAQERAASLVQTWTAMGERLPPLPAHETKSVKLLDYSLFPSSESVSLAQDDTLLDSTGRTVWLGAQVNPVRFFLLDYRISLFSDSSAINSALIDCKLLGPFNISSTHPQAGQGLHYAQNQVFSLINRDCTRLFQQLAEIANDDEIDTNEEASDRFGRWNGSTVALDEESRLRYSLD